MNHYLRKLMALAFFALALTGAALAEDNSHLVRADIPFSFYAGGKLMPAGEYTIAVNLEDHAIIIGQRATGNRSFLLGWSDGGSRDERTVLTFTLVAGDVYALRDLQSPDFGVRFNAKTSESTTRVQNRTSEPVTIIAQAK